MSQDASTTAKLDEESIDVKIDQGGKLGSNNSAFLSTKADSTITKDNAPTPDGSEGINQLEVKEKRFTPEPMAKAKKHTGETINNIEDAEESNNDESEEAAGAPRDFQTLILMQKKG